MGYTRNDFLIVHSFMLADIEEARSLAVAVFPAGLVGPLMTSDVNSVYGFTVWTSGSKQGWPEAAAYEACTERLIEKLAAMKYPPSWCRVMSGDEAGDIAAEQGYDGDYTHSYTRTTAWVDHSDPPRDDD